MYGLSRVGRIAVTKIPMIGYYHIIGYGCRAVKGRFNAYGNVEVLNNIVR